jgi:hypothetical protein
METDMICRLRQKYAVVDLGELTDARPPEIFHPNTDAWGLADHPLRREPGASASPA